MVRACRGHASSTWGEEGHMAQRTERGSLLEGAARLSTCACTHVNVCVCVMEICPPPWWRAGSLSERAEA